MLKSIVVQSKLGSIIFSCFIHKRSCIEDLKLDLDTFYKKWRENHDLPKLPHYEIQILQAWRIRQHTSDAGRPVMLHIHKGNDENEYVCFTLDVASEEEAILVWKAWCVGTVYAILQYIKGIEEYNFDSLFASYGSNYDGFIQFLEDEEGIIINK